MSFLTIQVWGIKLWIILYLAIALISFIGVLIYLKREKIRYLYYKLRFPEKLIKIIIHYPSNMYKIYWRIIPNDKSFYINKEQYQYTDDNIIKDNPLLAYKEKDKYIFKILDKKYNLEELKIIENKKQKFPEIHYFYNNPNPIKFDYNSKNLKFTAQSLRDFKENDLFAKLLTLDADSGKLMFIFLLCVFNSIGILFLIAKMMGWLK